MFRLVSWLPRDGIARNTLAIWVYQFGAMGIGLAISVTVARYLGPERKGIVDLYLLLGALIGEFGLLGVSYGLVYYVANRKRPLDQAHAVALAISVSFGIVIAGVGIATFGIWSPLIPGLEFRIAVLCLAITPFAFYGRMWTNILTAIDRAVDIGRWTLVLTAASLIAVLILFWKDALTPWTMIILLASITVVTALVAAGDLFRRERGMRFDQQLARDCLRYGLLMYGTMLANFLHFKADQFMVNYWLGREPLAVYAVSVRWAELLFALDGAIVAASLARIAGADAKNRRSLTGRVTTAQAAIALSAALMIAAVAWPVIKLLYGDQFMGAVAPLWVLIPGVTAWSIQKVPGTLLVYNMGRAKLIMVLAMIGAVMNIGLNLAALEWTNLGIVGVAGASSISYIVVAALVLIYARSAMKLADTPETAL